MIYSSDVLSDSFRKKIVSDKKKFRNNPAFAEFVKII